MHQGKIVGSGSAVGAGTVDLVPDPRWMMGPVTVYVQASAAATIKFVGQDQSDSSQAFVITLPGSTMYERFDVNYEKMIVVSGTVNWYAVSYMD